MLVCHITPRSVVRRVNGSDEPDLTKGLVLAIPANARVAISSADVAEDEEDLQSGAGGNDMRHDVIWWAHNAKFHMPDNTTLLSELPLWDGGEHKKWR